MENKLGSSSSSGQCCVIADIVGSRNLANRDQAQKVFEEALARAAKSLKDGSVLRDPWATVGDEFQFVTLDFRTATQLTTLVMLDLNGGITLADLQTSEMPSVGNGRLALRFGLGNGAMGEASGRFGVLTGQGWIAARRALEIAESRARFAQLSVYVGKPGEECSQENAFLAMRDHIILKQNSRESRISYRSILGLSQQKIATLENITQPAVSQSLRHSGAYALRRMII